MKRPGPLLWLRYAYGGALPERYREWVLHDVTAPSWVVRHVLRGSCSSCRSRSCCSW